MDGYWTDGLFAWTDETVVCEALDSVNEVLSSLAPSPAPTLADIDCDTNGVNGELSFDDSNPIAEASYEGVDGIGSLAAVAVDGTFNLSGDRRGIINASTDTTGTIAEDVAVGGGSPNPSFPSNAFGDADQGTLKLELNGVIVRSIDLATEGAVNDGSSTSGFNIIAAACNLFPNGDEFCQFKYRTGSWRVDSSDMGLGWNYARVIHSLVSGDQTTNYVDWVIDANAVTTVYSSIALDTLSMAGSNQLSGITYHTSGTAQYDVTISHAQRNTYKAGSPITFNETNCTVSNQSFSTTGGNELQTTTFTNLVATVSTGSRILDGSISVVTVVDRTIDANEANSSSASISGILLDATTSSSTDLTNTFNDEDYRIQGSGNDFNTDLSSDWDESESVTGVSAGHNEGLQTYNGNCDYPSIDFSAITNGPAGNPDYSAATGVRYYFGYFTDSTSASNFRLTLQGSATLVVDADLSSSTNEVSVCLRWSTLTGWFDVMETFIDGNFGSTSEVYDAAPTDGCYAATFGSDQTIPTTNLGTSIGTLNSGDSSDKVYYRIKTASAWTGTLSNIEIEWNV